MPPDRMSWIFTLCMSLSTWEILGYQTNSQMLALLLHHSFQDLLLPLLSFFSFSFSVNFVSLNGIQVMPSLAKWSVWKPVSCPNIFPVSNLAPLGMSLKLTRCVWFVHKFNTKWESHWIFNPEVIFSFCCYGNNAKVSLPTRRSSLVLNEASDEGRGGYLGWENSNIRAVQVMRHNYMSITYLMRIN